MFTKAQGDRLRRIRAIDKLVEYFCSGSVPQLVSLFAFDCFWEIPTHALRGSRKPGVYESLLGFFTKARQLHVKVSRRHIADHSIILEGDLNYIDSDSSTEPVVIQNFRFCGIFEFDEANQIASAVAFLQCLTETETRLTRFNDLSIR
jgi:hypothetical protein